MIDNRGLSLPKENIEFVKRLCDRRFGIGGDGLIYLQNKEGYDFEMVYFNSDGRESTMCGNGGRCIVRFAHDLGLGDSEFSFLAIDGPHCGKIHSDGTVSLQMKDVTAVEQRSGDYILNTGSPHFVHFVENVRDYAVAAKGAETRYSDRFTKDGINVNFVESQGDDSIYVRTYERGVEDETLSCGTGVVASSIAWYLRSSNKPTDISVETPGGKLNVRFENTDGKYTNVWLVGPAVRVYDGYISK